MPTSGDLIRRWFVEVWNQGREATIDELCAKHAVGHGQTLDGSDIQGPDNFKLFWSAFREAFGSIHIVIHHTISEGELGMAHWTLTAKHAGTFLGISPSGKAITVKGMSVQRYVDGMIVEGWDNWDQLGALVQLGAVSAEKLAA